TDKQYSGNLVRSPERDALRRTPGGGTGKGIELIKLGRAVSHAAATVYSSN
ncbi:unnamed protein product, partial [marine sediment metagenome]